MDSYQIRSGHYGKEAGRTEGEIIGMERGIDIVLRLRNGESVEQLRKEGIEDEIIEKALRILE